MDLSLGNARCDWISLRLQSADCAPTNSIVTAHTLHALPVIMILVANGGHFSDTALRLPELKLLAATGPEKQVAQHDDSGLVLQEGTLNVRLMNRVFTKAIKPPGMLPAPFTHADDVPENLLGFNDHDASGFTSSLKSLYLPASSIVARQAEYALLARLPCFRATTGAVPSHAESDPQHDGIVARVGYVDIAEEGMPPVLMHTLTVHDESTTNLGAPPQVGVVLAHGYGGGVGIWFSSLYGLAKGLAHRGLPIYAFDWLGMARSARVSFPLTDNDAVPAREDASPEVQVRREAEIQEARAIAAEEYFVDSLERWRVAVGLRRMILVGHSLGGYLSAVYATKYPDRIERLVLVSPVGLPPTPPDVLPTDARQHAHDVNVPSPSAIEAEVAHSSPSSPCTEDAPSLPPPPKVKMPEWVVRMQHYLWGQGYTPFSVARAAGPIAPILFSWYSARRFAHLDPDEAAHLGDYIFHVNTAGRPAGEYALPALLRPGGWAFRPLSRQLVPWLRQRRRRARKTEGHPDIVFLYGEHDWMGLEHAIALRAAAERPEQVVVRRVPGAGHQVFMDHPENFVRLAVPAILGRDVEKNALN